MATWGDQTCQRFEATAMGSETGFSRLRVWHVNFFKYGIHNWYFGISIFEVELELVCVIGIDIV